MAAERKFIAENVRRVLLKEYLMKEVSRAGFGGLDVQRTPMGTSVVLSTERPGLVIGRRGQTIKTLTAVIEEHFGFENPQIEVHEVENPNLNAQIMAEKLAFSLERGWHFRRAGHSSVRRIMESGAKGCHIIIAGKLTGQRKRTEKFKDGYIKFCGEPMLEFMTKGYAVAKMKQGIIGVTVEIMKADAKLPADITVLSKTEAAEILPDLIAKEPVTETAEIEVPVKKTAKKKSEASEETVEQAADANAETTVKKTAKKKADANVKEKAEEPAAEAEVKEPVKKTAKKKADANVKEKAEEPAAEAEVKEPVKKTAKKKADAGSKEEKPKKAAKKKADAEPKVEEVAVKKTAKKKADAESKEETSEKADADKEAQ